MVKCIIKFINKLKYNKFKWKKDRLVIININEKDKNIQTFYNKFLVNYI